MLALTSQDISPVSLVPSIRHCFCVQAGNFEFGIPVADTQTIFKIDNLTRVPMSPLHIAGLTNLRGRVLTVISLRSLIGGSRANVEVGVLAIGLQVDGEDYALVVDQVGEVILIDGTQRLPPPAHFESDHAGIIEGLYRVGDDLVPVLDVVAMLQFKSTPSSEDSHGQR